MNGLAHFKAKMIGIEQIAAFIPEKRVSNYVRQEIFGIDKDFIEQKIGVRSIAIKEDKDNTSDLCIYAYQNLIKKISLRPKDIGLLIVVTQTPDMNIPHTSAIVHGKLGLPETCACFDVSLGCSGYVYGLSIIKSFMTANGITNGLLFTCDPYSKIVDKEDKNTSLLFGDAATVTLISENPVFTFGKFTFGTYGKDGKELMTTNSKLYMNGRAVFNFSAKYVPNDVLALLSKNNLSIDKIDKFIFHQGSRFIVNTIAKRLNLPAQKVIFDAYDYGNTVSSSIPIILEKEIDNVENKLILVSGFGVGLSWASGILTRSKEIL